MATRLVNGIYVTDLDGKLAEPSVAGTAGQILVAGADGNPVWGDPTEGMVVDPAIADSPNPIANSAIYNALSTAAEAQAIIENY